MTSETKKPVPGLTPSEREILHLVANAPTPIYLVKDESSQVIAAGTADGKVVDLDTIREMNRKGWFSRRRDPDRFILNSKGRRVIEARL